MIKKIAENKMFILQGGLFVFLLLRDINVLVLPGMFYLAFAMMIPFFLSKEEIIAYSVGFAMMGTGIQVVYVTAGCLFAYVYKKRFSFNKKQVVFSMIILIYEALHLVVYLGDSPVEFLRYAIVYIYVFIMLFDEYDNDSIVIIAKVYISATVFVCIDVLFQMLTILNISMGDYLNMSLRLGYSDQLQQTIRFSADPNLLAQSCTISMVMCVVLMKKKYTDVFLKIAVLLLLLFGLMTLSKTFLLSLVVVVFCIILNTSQEKKSFESIKNAMIAFVCIIVALIIVYNVYPNYFDNIAARFDPEDLTTGRVRIAQKYINYLLGEPFSLFFGLGLQNIGEKSMCVASPHAAFIECLVSFGLLGTIFIIYIVINSIKQITKNKKRSFLSYMPLVITVVLIQSTQFFRMRDRILTLIAVVVLCGIESRSKKNKGVENEKTNIDGH